MSASLRWEPEDDIELERGKRMVLTCKVHGVTDDMILFDYGSGRSHYVCRKCNTAPCPIHGHDYTTLLGKRKRNVCVVCEPNALMVAADKRNDRRRSDRLRAL